MRYKDGDSGRSADVVVASGGINGIIGDGVSSGTRLGPNIFHWGGYGNHSFLTSRIAKRGVSYVLTAFLAVGLFFGFGWYSPEAAAHADEPEPVTVGDFTLTGDSLVSGTDYSYNSNILTIRTGKEMTVRMKTSGATTTKDRILVDLTDPAYPADLTLNGVKINKTTGSNLAFDVSGGALDLTLAGENSLTSKDGAGLQLSNGADLVITEAFDGGSLEAMGGDIGGAGIGGGYETSAGDITIDGGTITATGSSSGGAGIGGGYETSAGDITIDGGTITAMGSSRGGAGIGGGDGSFNSVASVGEITINDGMVTADGIGAGIGGGYVAGDNANASADAITILGGTVTATGIMGAGIGGGCGGNHANASADDITIEGGVVNATSLGYGAGIGGGAGWDGDASTGEITINDGAVTATGSAAGGGAGIGGGFGSSNSVASVGEITISGGTVTAAYAVDDKQSQDIGNGFYDDEYTSAESVSAESVTIDGGSVHAVHGAVQADDGVGAQNAKGDSVFENELSFNPALASGTAITGGAIDGVPASLNDPDATNGVYGLRGVKALEDSGTGKVWLWLPSEASPKAKVQLNAGGEAYGSPYARPQGKANEELHPCALLYFEMNGHGTLPEGYNPQIATIGQPFSPPQDPSAEGYDFDGWYADKDYTGSSYDFSTPSEKSDLTLYAKWAPKAVAVAFYNNYSATDNTQYAPGNTANAGKSVGDTLNKPGDPSSEGYTFGGWSTNRNGTPPWNFDSDTVPTTATVNLYAIWTVTYDEDKKDEDKKDDEKLSVKAESVALSGAPAQFPYKASGKDNTLKLGATVLPANTDNKQVEWASSNNVLATVDADGHVTFKGPEGDVKITATAKDGSGKFAEQTIKVVKNVTSIRTPLTKLSIQKGKSLTLPVALDDKTAPKASVSSKLEWKSSNTKVLTVKDGKIKANKKIKKKKNVKVTVKAANGKSLTIKVTVAPKATKLKKVTAKFPKKKRMKVGATYQLKIKLKKATATGVKVTFKSSKRSVIRVDKAGKLFALKKGKATITIKAGKKSIKKKITVK
jgi:uncharacterized repeat protein (TIGR02543 family)